MQIRGDGGGRGAGVTLSKQRVEEQSCFPFWIETCHYMGISKTVYFHFTRPQALSRCEIIRQLFSSQIPLYKNSILMTHMSDFSSTLQANYVNCINLYMYLY